MRAPLRFPRASAPQLSADQLFVSRASSIFDEVEEQPPTAGLLMLLRRRHFESDSSRMLAALEDMALSGQLSRGLPYFCAVIASRSARGEFAQAPSPAPRTIAVGTRDRSGRYFFDGSDWALVPPSEEPK